MEDITDGDYIHAKRVCKDFEIKNLAKYCNLYLKSHTLFLADAFENFRKMCLKIYHLDSAKFVQLHFTEVKLELLTDIDMLSMVKRRIRGEICDAIDISLICKY